MKHRVKSKRFNRDTSSRKALLRNSLRALIEHGHIETNESRAKEVRRLADKLITKAKKGDLASRRELHKFFTKRDVVNTLVDQVAPALADRQSGFRSLEKLSKRRGDNVTMYRLSLLVKEKTWDGLHRAKASKASPAKAKSTSAKKSQPAKKTAKKASKPAATSKSKQKKDTKDDQKTK